MHKLQIFKELWHYVRQRKQWVIVPLVVFLALLGFFIIFAETSVFAPLIYTLF